MSRGSETDLKQAWQRRTQLLTLLILLPSPPTKFKPICSSTFWTAKSDVMHALLRIARGLDFFLPLFFFLPPPVVGRARPRSTALCSATLLGVIHSPSESESCSSSSTAVEGGREDVEGSASGKERRDGGGDEDRGGKGSEDADCWTQMAIGWSS